METLSRHRAVPRASRSRDARARTRRVVIRAAGAPPPTARAGRRPRARDDDRDRDARRPRARGRVGVAVCATRATADASASRGGRRRRRECVVYWDLDNARPPAHVEAVWAARLRRVGEEYADACRVVAYANARTMSRPNMRASLERVGVEIVEVSDVAEAADERLMTDVYSRARDAADVDDADALATVVVSSDARLSVCVEQARVRGVFTVVVSDFLRTWRSRPEFTHLLARFSAGRSARVDESDDAEAYARALHIIGASGKLFKHSKLARSADVALVWDPQRVLAVTRDEALAHALANDVDVDDFGQPTAAPGGVVGALSSDGTIAPWPTPRE